MRSPPPPSRWQPRTVAALLVALALAALPGCLRRSVAERNAEEARTRSADSAHSADVQRVRSSATQAVDFTDEERRRYSRVEQMIQAKFSGVRVVQNASGYVIQVRGAGSFGSSTDPLVVIDGAARTVADLRGVDPKDVQRIEIVKDAAASYYGVRGANGVVVITTRRR